MSRVYAQNTDILELEEVVVGAAPRLHNFSDGNHIQHIDSTGIQNNIADNLGDLLSQQAQVFIKAYGPGNMSTISMRGANASHTPVIWNGFNLQGPTLGQMDFSLFPVSFADDIYVQHGGAGALFGAGAVGGAIHIGSQAKFNKGIEASIINHYGSFDYYHQTLRFSLSKKRWVTSLKFFNSDAQNNFPFINTAIAGSPKVNQTNAAVKQTGLLWENYYKINNSQQINLRFWLQDNYREVPPLMTNAVNRASLSNDFYRMSAEWKKSASLATFFVRTAWFNDVMYYNDPLAPANSSKTQFNTSISEAESHIYIAQNHSLNLGINNTYQEAVSGGYPEGPARNRTALFASYKVRNKKSTWQGSLNLRQEMVAGKLIPFTPSLGMEGHLIKPFYWKANISRNYRLPTFNDLFWKPGGNPELKPESGWSEELSLIAKSAHWKSFINNSMRVTVFNSHIKNWIIWLPDSSLWTSQNEQKVWSRGIESSIHSTLYKRKLRVDFTFLYNYVLSTNEKPKSVNDESFKKQLIYVPIYNGQANIFISYKDFYLNYVHTYTGNRFTASDNTDYVKGYMLGNVTLGKNFIIEHVRINAHLKINNIWNQSYQVVQWQAMPMRYYQAGVAIFFNKPNKNHTIQ